MIKKLYHATASVNAVKILSEGLKVDQREGNAYSLDKDYPYELEYKDEELEEVLQKANSIHLTPVLSSAEFYMELIESSFKVRAEILEVEVDDSLLNIDPEDDEAYYILEDLPPQAIRRYQEIILDPETELLSDRTTPDSIAEGYQRRESEVFEEEAADSDEELESNGLDSEQNSDAESEASALRQARQRLILNPNRKRKSPDQEKSNNDLPNQEDRRKHHGGFGKNS